jgi:L-lactate dehydrogenase (cytochrome)
MCGVYHANVKTVLKAETETCMRLLGVEKIEQLGMQHINTRAVERDIWDGPALERMAVKAML